MFAITRRQLLSALSDVAMGVLNWRLWHLLAWQEIKQRYRRSTLGPLWLSLSMAIQMAVLGSLVTFLFNSSFERYLPFVCAGLIIWALISQIVIDGAMAFINANSYIMQIRKPLTIYVFQVIWRNIIISGHNMVVYIVVAAIFLIVPNANTLLLPVGLALSLLSVAWLALFLAILSARFRDIPMIVQSLFGVLFWGTPLMYRPEQLGSKQFITELNPFTHVVALIRDPLLGQAPTSVDWMVVGVMAMVGWIATLLFFARFRTRVPYWI